MRIANLSLALLLMVALGSTAHAADGRITFTKDVLPILQENCQSCHRPGGDNVSGMVAPFSLMTFREARPWAKSIAKNVSSGAMPPWFATEEFSGVFLNERSLTQQQIETIVEWADTGAARGNPQDAPPAREFAGHNGWMTGKQDIVVEMPYAYFVEDDVVDEYVNFLSDPISESELPANRWLRSIEWRGDSDVVHHIVGAATIIDPDGSVERFELGSIAPGEEGTNYPEGYGKLLRAGSRINFNMHYHKEAGPGTGKWDRSMVGFRFWDDEKDPPVKHFVHRNGVINRYFEIPPHHANWPVSASRTFENDTTILSFHPHMHLRGKDARYDAIYPDGTRETLLVVPAFDFNWQLDYSFAEPKRIPAGTRIEYMAHFDNSLDNAANPNADIPMAWGGPTTMEMMIGYISYSDSDADDAMDAFDVEDE